MSRTMKKRMLVVDDEREMLKVLSELFSDEGYSVCVAEDGIKAARQIEQTSFDVVITDLKLPGMDGISLLQKTRNATPNTIVIMITAYGTPESASRAMRLGAFDYIDKPFSLDRITSTVQKALEEKPVTEGVIKKDHLSAFVERLKAFGTVIAPQERDGRISFHRLNDISQLSLNYTSTILPLKYFFLPSSMPETDAFPADLFPDDTELGAEPKVFFGVHPHDMQAILRLDEQLGKKKHDLDYLERRKSVLFVGTDDSPDEYSFARGIGAYKRQRGFDIFLTDIGDKYFVKVNTPEGEKLLHNFDRLSEPTQKDRQKIERAEREAQRDQVSIGCHPAALPELIKLTLDDPLWNELEEKCTSCGKCNVVCPSSVTAFDTVKERAIEKYLHSAKDYGKPSCVGCGRCARICPADINPLRVIRALNKKYELSLLSKIFNLHYHQESYGTDKPK